MGLQRIANRRPAVLFPFQCHHQVETADIMEKSVENVKSYNSIFFGAIGDFRVKPGIMEQGVILRLRKELDLYMNIRPAISFSRITGNNIHMTILRENKEDFYSDISGSLNEHKLFRQKGNFYNYNIDINSESDDTIYYTMGFLSRKKLNCSFLIHLFRYLLLLCPH